KAAAWRPKLPNQATGGAPRVCRYSHRFKQPVSRARKATSAALRQDVRSANQSTGRGANHMRGERGSSPLPKYTRTAVAAIASTPESRRCELFVDSMEVPPKGTVAECAKFIGVHAEAAAEVQRHHALQECAQFKGDFPGIGAPDAAGLHAFGDHGSDD